MYDVSGWTNQTIEGVVSEWEWTAMNADSIRLQPDYFSLLFKVNLICFVLKQDLAIELP